MARTKAASRPDLLEAAFEQIGDTGWAGWSPTALAASTGRDLAEIYDVFPVPSALARRLGERLDRAMLALERLVRAPSSLPRSPA